MRRFRRSWFWWCIGLGLIILALIWAAYKFSWPGTGFQGKTVWDWLQLLIVPAALALVALLFNQANTRTERQIAKQRYEQDQQIALDKQREDLLQAYLDRMSELVLEKGLRTSRDGTEVRNVARTRTISVLRQLDGRRIRGVFMFLSEAGLTNPPDPIISLKKADLSRVNWSEADLSRVNLSEATLSRATLSRADLSGVDLSGADLSEAYLSEANLDRATLSDANLSDADFTRANFTRANFTDAILNGANFTGATLYEANFTRAILSLTDSAGASVRGATFKDAKIDKSQLTPEQIAQAIWD